jgi:peptidoglycan/LPS O-acetylase OafA/YrhL
MSDDRQFSVLDGMRGVAALIVMQRHTGEAFGTRIFSGGYLAVDFFFALSGFVLAYAYDERLAAGLPWYRFMLLRLIRLYPLYLAGVLLLVLATPSLWPDVGGLLAKALLFLPDGTLASRGWLVPPAWSLAFELVVNLGFAFGHRYLASRTLLAIVAVAGAALAVTAVRHGNLDTGYNIDTLGSGLARAAFSFPMGILLFRHRNLFARWPVVTGALPILALVMALWVASQGLTAARDLAIVMLALPLLLVLGSTAKVGPRGQWWMLRLGAASYAIYVLHGGAIALVQRMGWDAGFVPAGLFMAAMLVIGALLDRYADLPLRRSLTTHLVLNPSAS